MSLSENKRTEKISDSQKNFNVQQRPLFDLPAINRKRVGVSFTAQEVSSDGGLLLFKETERHLGIIKALSECITDPQLQSYRNCVHRSSLSGITSRNATTTNGNDYSENRR